MSIGFVFKEFSVSQQISAFKVGTDSVLLGAWADIAGAKRILDIGTGTGILALMCAQRNAAAWITGIDIDQSSADEAASNFARSKWRDRLNAKFADLLEFRETGERFDHIISNPPYFTNGPRPRRKTKELARHMVSWENWLNAIALLLGSGGKVSIIIPYSERNEFVKVAAIHSLHVSRECRIYTMKSDISRLLLELSRDPLTLGNSSVLRIYNGDQSYSEEYRELTKAFYLFF
jgi:tRNA1Val (adenine37-N6)-methyltransferase